MKKQIASLLAAFLLLGLTACGGGGTAESPSAGSSASEGAAGTSSAEEPSAGESSAGETSADVAPEETEEVKTETVELTMDNFFDYFEFKTFYTTLTNGFSMCQRTSYVLKEEYDGRLVFPEGSELPEITVSLGKTELEPAGDKTVSLYVDDYNYPFFFIEEMSAERECTLTAVSGSLIISDTAAEVVRPVVEEVADFEPVVLADTGAVRVTLTGMTRVTGEYGEETPAKTCVYEIQIENLISAYSWYVDFEDSDRDYLAGFSANNEAARTGSFSVTDNLLSDTSVDEFAVTLHIDTGDPETEATVETTLPW